MKFNITGYTRNLLPFAVLSVAVSMLILSACGGGGSGGTSGGNSLTRMGGVLQGAALNLTHTVSTFAGLSSLNTNADGTGGAASFNAPLASVADSFGNLYVADSANNTIRKIDAKGVVTTLAGSLIGASGVQDATTGTAATFNGPSGITTDGVNLYVADTKSSTIRVISPAAGATLATITSATAVVTTLAGNGTGSPKNGLGSNARFKLPVGITTNGTNLFVTDTGNNIIRIIAASGVASLANMSSSTAAVTTLSLGYVKGNSYNSYGGPTGITTDNINLYVADTGNNQIIQIAPTGGATLGNISAASAVANVFVGGYSGAYDTNNNYWPGFNSPSGITNDGSYLYVADKGNNKIRKILIDLTNSALTSSLTGVANTAANIGYADGTAANATFSGPAGISISPDGKKLYVMDTNNNTIRQITPNSIGSMFDTTATVTTLAGVATSNHLADGTGMAARMDMPQYSTTDGTNLYVTDCNTMNGTAAIRKVEIATGVETTLAASGVQGSRDGLSTMSTFTCPSGITTDGTNLYVADTGNNSISRIAASGVGATLSSMNSSNAAVTTMLSGMTSTPWGITTDGINLYVANTDSIVRLAPPTGTSLRDMTSGVPITSTMTSMLSASAVGITTNGQNLYVTDGANNTIYMVAPPKGESLSSMAAASATFSSITILNSGGAADDTGVKATFNTPTDITTDGTNLYVVDSANNKIRMIAPTGGATLANIKPASAVVSSITGVSGVSGVGVMGYADGPGPMATFNSPNGITTDGHSLFVMDNDNGTIRQIK